MNPFIDKFKMAGKVMDVCDSTARGLITTLQNAFNNLATVARTGSYNDLRDKPTIPTAQINSDWNATSGVAEILNKPNLATVATSGSYNDLSNKPSIPAEQVNSDWDATSGKAEILNKPTLATVATSGSYTDLDNKPNGSDFIQSLNGTVNLTGVSGNWVLHQVTFATPFKVGTTPLVSVYRYDSATNTTWTLPMIKNLSNTGFEFGWYNASGSHNFIWMAIGIKS